MRVPRATCGDRCGAWVTAKPHHSMAGTRPGGDPAEHRRTPNLGQRRIVERQGLARLLLLERSVQLDAMAADEPHDPPPHGDEQPRYLDVGRRHRCGNEAQRSVGPLLEHALGYQSVEVDIGVERRATPLNGRHGATAALNALIARPAPLEGEQVRGRILAVAEMDDVLHDGSTRARVTARPHDGLDLVAHGTRRKMTHASDSS
jgi:hypothetical protein